MMYYKILKSPIEDAENREIIISEKDTRLINTKNQIKRKAVSKYIGEKYTNIEVCKNKSKSNLIVMSGAKLSDRFHWWEDEVTRFICYNDSDKDAEKNAKFDEFMILKSPIEELSEEIKVVRGLGVLDAASRYLGDEYTISVHPTLANLHIQKIAIDKETGKITKLGNVSTLLWLNDEAATEYREYYKKKKEQQYEKLATKYNTKAYGNKPNYTAFSKDITTRLMESVQEQVKNGSLENEITAPKDVIQDILNVIKSR